MQLPNLIPKAPAETVATRLEICASCELRGKIPLTNADYCTACGCPLASKTKLLHSHCPKGKW